MDFKKKLKAFFTVSGRSSGGFTLVELVIVIAVLAILAGVSIPVYNNYIEKSNMAADQVLLDAVNRAFASACVENHYDSLDVAAASVKVDNQYVTGLGDIALKEGAISDQTKVDTATSFMLFMLGNENTAFRDERIKSLQWAGDHFEFDYNNVAVPVVVLSNGQAATLDQAALNAIAESFMADMTAEEMTQLMEVIKSNTTDSMITLAGEKISDIIGSTAYKALSKILN